MSPILEHPDVQRMLMTMKSLVQAARGICHLTGVAIDRSFHAPTAEERAAAGERAALLTPIAKALSTDIGDEVASLGVQVHGGMGYIEETGAAQFMRDARIAAIYEGTNGIQAIDLVQRKLPLSGRRGGRARNRRHPRGRRRCRLARRRRLRRDGAAAGRGRRRVGAPRPAFCARRSRAIPTRPSRAPTPYLRLFGLALGGACLAKAGLAAQSAPRQAGGTPPLGRVALARFFAEKLATAAPGLAQTVLSGGAALEAHEAALQEFA